MQVYSDAAGPPGDIPGTIIVKNTHYLTSNTVAQTDNSPAGSGYYSISSTTNT